MFRILCRIAVCLVVTTSLAPAAASACSCTNTLTLEEEFGFARAVFSGRVLAIQPSYDPNMLVVIFEPIERWTGSLSDPQAVFTPLGGGSCGYPFEVGQDYLVFASLIYTGITYTPADFTHLCSRTSPLAGNPYIALLPPSQLPVPARRSSWGRLKLHYR